MQFVQWLARLPFSCQLCLTADARSKRVCQCRLGSSWAPETYNNRNSQLQRAWAEMLVKGGRGNDGFPGGQGGANGANGELSSCSHPSQEAAVCFSCVAAIVPLAPRHALLTHAPALRVQAREAGRVYSSCVVPPPTSQPRTSPRMPGLGWHSAHPPSATRPSVSRGAHSQQARSIFPQLLTKSKCIAVTACYWPGRHRRLGPRARQHAKTCHVCESLLHTSY